jgi:hypothetical protein
LITIQEEIYIVDILYRSTNFRTTIVKLYFTEQPEYIKKQELSEEQQAVQQEQGQLPGLKNI